MNRVYLNKSDQILEQLRRQIQIGTWKTRLPSERELARELGVSRWSLRPALHELKKEGLIEERSQKGTLLTKQKRPQKQHQPSVGIILSNRTEIHEEKISSILYGIQHQLQRHNIRLELHPIHYPVGDQVPSSLIKSIRYYNHDCWMLIAPTIGMQRWCQKNQIPVVILGLGEKEFELPFVGLNHHAICRHAVTEMIRRGHRHVSLITARDEKGEDRQSRLGFLAGIEDFSHLNIRYSFEHHNQNKISVHRLINRLLLSRPRPTAWLICREGHFYQIFTYLQHLGIRIPEEISLISRDYNSYFRDLHPIPAHYYSSSSQRLNQYSRMILKVISRQARPGENILTIPEFITGQTLGPPPEVDATETRPSILS